MIDRLMPDLPQGRSQWLRFGGYLLVMGLSLFPVWAPVDLAPWRLEVLRWCAPLFILAVLGRSLRPNLVVAIGIFLGIMGGDLFAAAGMLCIAKHRRGIVATRWSLVATAALAAPGVPLITMGVLGTAMEPLARDIVRSLGAMCLLVILPAVVGAYLGQHEDLVESLQHNANEIAEHQELLTTRATLDERARIAGEMHDVLGHKLSLITMQAGAIEMAAAVASPEKLESLAQQLRETSRAALEDLRDVLSVLGTESTSTAPQPHVAEIEELIDNNRAAGAKIAYEERLAAPLSTVGATIGRTAYRLVQEALTNAHKHAPGAQVKVILSGAPGRGLTVSVHNYRLVSTPRGTGNGSGLTRLSERVRLAGGQFETISTPDTWEVTATLPWAPQGEQ